MTRWYTSLVAMPMIFASLVGCTDGIFALGGESTIEADEAIMDCSVVWQQELLITDEGVVRDARAFNNGPWSFGGVMRAVAGQTNEQEFVKRSVESWMTDQLVDGAMVEARPKMVDLVLKPWKAKSPPGTYDLSKAPFQLLAIVYRPDLRKQPSADDGAGEGRFVWGLTNSIGRPQLFVIIAEFALPIDGGRSALDWAHDWHSLGKLELGSPEYNQKLEEITNQFAGSTVRAGATPGSALEQIRSNEIALDSRGDRAGVWQLREFRIGSDGYLHPVRPALTPSNGMNGSSTLTRYVQQNAKQIEAGTHELPVNFRGAQFSAGAADVPTRTFTWSVPNVSTELQRKFSMQTCNGCHAGDTETRFLHVAPNFQGGTARLSDFVMKIDMPERVADFKALLGCR